MTLLVHVSSFYFKVCSINSWNSRERTKVVLSRLPESLRVSCRVHNPGSGQVGFSDQISNTWWAAFLFSFLDFLNTISKWNRIKHRKIPGIYTQFTTTCWTLHHSPFCRASLWWCSCPPPHPPPTSSLCPWPALRRNITQLWVLIMLSGLVFHKQSVKIRPH